MHDIAIQNNSKIKALHNIVKIDIPMIIANKVRINGTDSEDIKVTQKNYVKEMRLVAIGLGRRV